MNHLPVMSLYYILRVIQELCLIICGEGTSRTDDLLVMLLHQD